MSKELKKQFYKMIITHKCRIKQYQANAPEPVKLNEIVIVPSADVNYLIGIKRVKHYEGPEEAGTIIGEDQQNAKKRK